MIVDPLSRLLLVTAHQLLKRRQQLCLPFEQMSEQSSSRRGSVPNYLLPEVQVVWPEIECRPWRVPDLLLPDRPPNKTGERRKVLV